MLFCLYNEDGSIHQSNKVYDPEGYDKLLLDRGHKFIAVNHHMPLPPDHFMVDIGAKEICERPVMPIEVSKTVIKAGDDDSALFTNCPKDATFSISTGGIPLYGANLDATELELHIPVPCVYRVTFDLWPFKQFTIDIEAIAS